MTFFSHQTFF